MALSNAMYRILDNLKNKRDPFTGCRGMSQHGGWTRAAQALLRRGFIKDIWTHGVDAQITEAGLKALAEDQAREKRLQERRMRRL